MASVTTPPGLYTFRIRGRLGATALSAFPVMVPELKAGETILSGPIEDQSALFGVIAQIETLGLELLELRQVRPIPPGPEADSGRHEMACEAIDDADDIPR